MLSTIMFAIAIISSTPTTNLAEPIVRDAHIKLATVVDPTDHMPYQEVRLVDEKGARPIWAFEKKRPVEIGKGKTVGNATFILVKRVDMTDRACISVLSHDGETTQAIDVICRPLASFKAMKLNDLKFGDGGTATVSWREAKGQLYKASVAIEADEATRAPEAPLSFAIQ